MQYLRLEDVCQTAVFFGEELARYGFGSSHPLGNDRIHAFWSRLQAKKVANVVVEPPAIASEEDALTFHDKEYVELVKMASKHGGTLLDKGDTPAFKGVLRQRFTPLDLLLPA